MERLNTYIKHYFRAMYYNKCNTFHFSMLHDDFVNIVNECPKLEEYLVRIYNTYKKLDRGMQTYIYKGFIKNNLIEKLCTGLVEPIHYEEIPQTMRELFKKFFYYLYDDLLGTVALETACSSFHDYHQKFLEENDNMAFCPFCGLFPLTNQGVKYRDDYDHYFPRSIYIFNSVNFKNLIPMCNICNSMVKGNKDIIYDGRNKTNRRKAYYPYRNQINVGDVKVLVDQDHSGGFEIQLLYPSALSEEMESWMDIFDIKSRYRGVITDSSKRWNKRFRSSYKRTLGKQPTMDFSDFVAEELSHLDDRNYENTAFLEKAYIEFMAQFDSFESDLKETIRNGSE